ncbi:MAG TPA: polyprenyl synthetase family protein [Chitinophagaceae bacterium]|nr:polyprenyl synthetase family protein [Chitinophagaceae bacterium]
MKYTKFLSELADNELLVNNYINTQINKRKKIVPPILEECALSYVKQGGKKLRPAVLMLSCLAVGGEKMAALPACAAVELFHTWTLVHDDIIDNDSLRRGTATVHKTAENYAIKNLGLTGAVAQKYGTDIAILTGDIQHGWAISILSENLISIGVRPEIALHLITILQTNVLRTLVEGEILDVDFGLGYTIQQLNDDQILDMLWKKTGILYEFCGVAGALIGKNSIEYDSEVNALKEFCSLCGTAFQVRDDILGLIGKEAELGKPIGSDIREGKKTLLVLEALTNANEVQKLKILKTLGNSRATETEITEITKIIVDLGGVDKAHAIAKKFVDKALPNLDILKPSDSVDLLHDWASYMIDRNF